MSIVSLLTIIASLTALSMLHEEKRIDDTCAIVTLVAALACVPSCILGDPVVSIVGPLLTILCIVGSMIMIKQSNRELGQALRRDAAKEAAGPSVSPLSEAELSERILQKLASYESGIGPDGSKYASSFWIDDVGDILGPWERRNHA